MLRLRVPLWERIAYYCTIWLWNLTVCLHFRYDVSMKFFPWGWWLIAWHWGINDRLIPGKAGKAWRVEHLPADWLVHEVRHAPNTQPQRRRSGPHSRLSGQLYLLESDVGGQL